MYHLTHSLSSSLPSAPGVSRIRSVDVKGESQAHHSPMGSWCTRQLGVTVAATTTRQSVCTAAFSWSALFLTRISREPDQFIEDLPAQLAT